MKQCQVSQSIQPNAYNQIDGLTLLRSLADDDIPAVFFDPQYRGLLERLAYGNEGQSRGRIRSALPQMTGEVIQDFLGEIKRVLRPSGHLFLWLDKFELCTRTACLVEPAALAVVDLITWDKKRLGMGYRTRRSCEYLLVVQKKPIRAKGVWLRRDIPDVWTETVSRRDHPHRKPVGLQTALIEAVTRPAELIVDPAAGSYSVWKACEQCGREFLGCDLLFPARYVDGSAH